MFRGTLPETAELLVGLSEVSRQIGYYNMHELTQSSVGNDGTITDTTYLKTTGEDDVLFATICWSRQPGATMREEGRAIYSHAKNVSMAWDAGACTLGEVTAINFTTRRSVLTAETVGRFASLLADATVMRPPKPPLFERLAQASLTTVFYLADQERRTSGL